MTSEGGANFDVAEEFVERFFNLSQEIKLLQTDRADLKDEFKDRLDTKLMGKLVRLVKLKLDVAEADTSEETVAELENIILNHVNKVR